MKIKWWCDSGANIHSCKEGAVTLEDLGFTEVEWNARTDDERESIMREIAWDTLDWGFYAVEGEGEENHAE